MFLTSILIFAQLSAPDLDQKVSIDIRGGNGKEVSAELSRKTGIRFETADAATLDRFVIHIDNQPLSQVMSRIADAEHGEWLRTEKGYRLRRSAAKVAALLAAIRARVAKAFQEKLDGYRKALAATPVFDDAAARDLSSGLHRPVSPPGDSPGYMAYFQKQIALQSEVPIERAARRVLLTFTPEQLVEIPADTHIVFSTHPTEMQYAFPPAALTALESLASEQASWHEAEAGYGADATYDSTLQLGQVANAVLILDGSGDEGWIHGKLLLVDSKDRIIARPPISLSGEDDEPEPFAPGQQPDKKLPLSDLNAELLRAFAPGVLDSKFERVVLSKAAKAVIEDPEKVDPLATFVAGGLIALAQERQENFVGVINDRSVGEFVHKVAKYGLDSKVLDAMKWNNWHALTEDKEWLVMSETRPDRADEIRCDRKALHSLIDAARAHGRVTLEDAALYSLSSPRFQENPLAPMYLGAVLGGYSADVLWQSDKNVLRFYGSLDDLQRANADHLPLSSLTEFQLGLLAKMVYNDQNALTFGSRYLEGVGENGQRLNPYETLLLEPTYALGNGIPPNGFLRISQEKSSGIVDRTQSGGLERSGRLTNLEMLAGMIATWGGRNKVVGMHTVGTTKLILHFQFTPDISFDPTLTDTAPTSAETATVAGLPEDVRDKLQTEIDRYAQQYRRPALDQDGTTKSGPP